MVIISGTGLWKPESILTNEELVDSYNQYVDKYNAENESEISGGSIQAKQHSSAAFIEKASGIKQRYIYQKDGVLDIDRMQPKIAKKADDELSDQALMAIEAAKRAMEQAGKEASDIDAIIVSCAYTQRYYPAIAIEVQEALNIKGFGFDMLVACSSATFGIHRAYEMVKSGTSKCVMVINPELTSPQVNYKDRDSHFIFGDVSIATIVESSETATSEHSFEIQSTKAETKYSNNIRSNFGYLMNTNDTYQLEEALYFSQKGRAVFKEVCPMVVEHITDHLDHKNIDKSDIKRWWLHQANSNMNQWICKSLLTEEMNTNNAPIILDEYANTASAGSLIAFHLYKDDFKAGEYGVICSFGAGYSIGSLIVRKQ